MRWLFVVALAGGCTAVDDYGKFTFATPPDLGAAVDLGAASSDAGQPVGIGSACTRNTCAASLTCIENWPSGFCTRLCSPATDPCPADTVCVSVNNVSGGATKVCAPSCDTLSTCRGGYECCPLLVGGGACLPTGATCQ